MYGTGGMGKAGSGKEPAILMGACLIFTKAPSFVLCVDERCPG